MPIGPLTHQGNEVHRGEKGKTDRYQRHQHQPRRAIDNQENENHKQDRHAFRVLDALLLRPEQIGSDGRRTGHPYLQASGKARLLLDLPHRAVDLVDELHVVDGHELVVQLQQNEHGPAVGASQLAAHEFIVMGHDRRDRGLLVGLRGEPVGQTYGDGLVFVSKFAIRPSDHEHDTALGGQLRKGFLLEFLASHAGHRGRQISEITVVRDLVPLGRNEKQQERDYDPGDQHPDPIPRNEACELCEHAQRRSSVSVQVLWCSRPGCEGRRDARTTSFRDVTSRSDAYGLPSPRRVRRGHIDS